MATSLKAVIALSEDPTVDNFLDVQNNCTNEPALTGDKNRLSSWEKYFYYTNYTISTSLSSSSVAASGGAITITYTIKQNASNSNGNAKVVSGVTPTVTSTIGTVSNITATNSNGVGTAKITVGSLGTTIQDITTGIITVSANGSSKSSNFTRSLNDVTSIKIAGSIPATGDYSNPTTYYPAAGSSYVYTVYAYFSSGAGKGNFSVTQNAYSISGDGFSKAQYSTATYAISTTAANRTTIIGDERSGVLTASYTTQITKKTLTDSITLTQEANVRTLSSVYTVPYKPDSSWITDITGSGSSTNWATVPASGGYLKSHAYANYTHTSGSSLNNQHITTDAAFVWSGSPSWITTHSSGGYYVNPNCGNADTRNSTGTYSYTYNGVKKTCTEAITQSGDTYTDSWNYKTDASLSKTSATCSSGTLTLTVKVYRRKYRNWGCGTDGYITDYTLFDTTPAVSDNVDWLSVGSFTKSSTGTYTATVTYNANSKNTSARTATITVTANSKSSTATLTQSKDTYTESGGVITYGNITGCSTTDGDVPCSGGSATAKASNGTQS